MQNKFLVFTLVSLMQLCCINAWADGTLRSVKLVKTSGGVVVGRPSSRPTGETNAPISAYINYDELVVVSEDVESLIMATISSEDGEIVDSISAYVSAGSEISLDIADLPTGMYILEISFDDTVYVGQFEL